jgi:competence ComEA-like helix-hairpin-helix protein
MNISFSASQKRGILALMGILATIGAAQYFYIQINSPTLTGNLPTQLNAQNAISSIEINSADSLMWVQLPGIGEKLSARIIKYRESVGGFLSIEDLKKVYGLKPETFENILPYLSIDTTNLARFQQASHKDKMLRPIGAELSVLDINKATEEDFKKLPGIGEVLSQRIVKYRTAMGGNFKNVEQVAKVYGLPPETFDNIRSYLIIKDIPQQTGIENIANSEKGKKDWQNNAPFAPKTDNQSAAGPKFPVDINTSDSLQFLPIPGIGEKIAGKIVRYRKLIGGFAKVEHLQYVYGFSPENFAKAKPYVKVNGANIEKKDFNKVQWSELIKYPSMNKDLTSAIITYRKLNGYFRSWEDVKAVPNVSKENVEVLECYFKI